VDIAAIRQQSRSIGDAFGHPVGDHDANTFVEQQTRRRQAHSRVGPGHYGA